MSRRHTRAARSYTCFPDTRLCRSGEARLDAVTVQQGLHYAGRPARTIGEAARVLRPGGRLFIVDFQAHDLDYLRSEHEHRWLGFQEDEMAGWLSDAGLQPEDCRRLTGKAQIGRATWRERGCQYG